jgi:16S rRNA G966 N2-methylase RsmD
VPHSNRQFYGANLDILRRYIKDESVDLVYLDPPFNSPVRHCRTTS